MARQDDATKLLAIGLLNFSDDEGYFYACPSLVRSALRPFDDDSTNVRRSLAQLAKIGFIEVREHSTHGPVGMVLSFADHQRVDRPKASIIKELYDSTINRRSIDDQSSLEGKGTVKGKEQGREQKAGKPPLWFPDSFSEKRKATLTLWAKHKTEKGQGYKPTGWQTMLSKLDAMTDDQLAAAVTHSMAMNYQGIFAPRDEPQQEPPKPTAMKAPEGWRDAAKTLYGHDFAGKEFDQITRDERADIIRSLRD